MADQPKCVYTAVTFAPVQGFIEKSRKLRDLYGASVLLSYMSKKIIDAVCEMELDVISPGTHNIKQGTPNRILIKGNFPENQAREVFLSSWKEVIYHCEKWLSENLRHLGPYHWEREWNNWANHSWEIFWSQGDSPTSVMRELETNKLARDWIGINWIGESSSLTGADGIAFPGLGGNKRNPANIDYRKEKEEIERFYTELAKITENTKQEEVEGKFIDPREKLSIPELTKRLVTYPDVGKRFQLFPLPEGFQEIQRKPDPQTGSPGQWTGWFMGDGDKVGDHLQKIAVNEGDVGLKNFSTEMQKWGENFSSHFQKGIPGINGRIVYAGGDDFLGVIYSNNPREPISPLAAYEWLITLNHRWQEHKQPITLSVGFVWVAGSVPQRDVLQHCREAQKLAKSSGRNRVAIRVLFNSGQYVQWTCPWDYLYVLKKYRDRDGKTYAEWESNGRDSKFEPNWNHVYNDLMQLRFRNAINLSKQSSSGCIMALDLFDIYFTHKEYLDKNAEEIVGSTEELYITKWISNLINVGWQICTSI
jgi:CRISPR-associated protein Cmr2